MVRGASKLLVLTVLVGLLLSVMALATAAPQDHDEHLPATTAPHAVLVDAHPRATPAPLPHPAIPMRPVWAGAVLIVVGFLFFAAAFIGPMRRIHLGVPQEPPVPSGDGHGH